MKPTKRNFPNERFPIVEISGPKGEKVNALFSVLRISEHSYHNLPKEVVTMAVRDADDGSEFATIEDYVIVNHAGDLIVSIETEDFLKGKFTDDYLSICEDSDWNMRFIDESQTYEEFCGKAINRK